MKNSHARRIGLVVLSIFVASVAAHAQKFGGLPRQVDAKVEYARLPLRFEPNRGQSGPPADFLARAQAYSLYLNGPAVRAVLRGPGQPVEIGWRFTRAARRRPAQPQESLPGVSNYLAGHDRSTWVTGVPQYGRVLYPGIYPGIDVVYYGAERQLEYDVIVAPGADPRRIELEVTGAAALKLDAEGNLLLDTGAGPLTQHRPYAYQMIGGRKVERAAAYVISASHRVRFQLGDYDRSAPLIIDPVVSFTTYLAGTGLDNPTGVAVDASGNTYITGYTTSTDFPATTGVVQNSATGTHAFVTKLNAAGTAVIWSTYLGGNGVDRSFAIALDSDGNSYLTGDTTSSDFPGASNTANGPDAFVAKLNPTGSAIVYSSYLGGTSSDFGQAIAIDSSRNAYVAGYTWSYYGFPTTAGAFQTALAGNSDAFVAKYDASGARVLTTLLGGIDSDMAHGIAVDSSRNIYVVGETASTNFPTAGSPYRSVNGGNIDAFVVKLNSAGNALVYSTYLGGSSYDVANALAVDAAGSAYVSGTTSSADYPATAGVVQPFYAGYNYSGFLAKVNPTGSALLYSTYINGSGVSATAVAVDAGGNAVVTGYSGCCGPQNLPLTVDAFQNRNLNQDAFLLKYDPNATAVLYGTLIGGEGQDAGTAVGLNAAGTAAYVAGTTNSTRFPATLGSFQTGSRTQQDGFIAKIDFSVSSAPNLIVSTGQMSFLSIQAPTGNSTPATQTISVASSGSPLNVAVRSFSTPSQWLSVQANNATTPATITVTADPTALAQGNYSGTILVRSANAVNGNQVIWVNLQVQRPYLTMSGSALEFVYDPTGSAPDAQTVGLTSTLYLSGAPTPPALDFTVLTTGASWLRVTPSSGTTPASLSFSVVPTGLPPGTYQSTVQVRAPYAATVDQTVAVTLRVGSQLKAAPAQMSLNWTLGATVPPSQAIVLSSSSAALPFVISAPSWLNVTPSSGTTPSTLTVDLITSGLTVGNYNGNILITSANAINSPLSIPVSMFVGQPFLSVYTTIGSPGAVLTAEQGATRPATAQACIYSPAPLSFTAAITGGSWLTVSPASGTLNPPNNTCLTVSANPAGKEAGTYTGVLTVTAPGASNSPQTVSITFKVGPILQTSQSGFAFMAATGGPVPASQNLFISAGSNIPITVAASTSSGGNWLTASPSAGTTPANIAIGVNPTGLAAGTYSGTITVSSPTAVNGSLIVGVTLSVGPYINVNGYLSFVQQQGGIPPLPQNLTITAGTSALPCTLDVRSASNWLKASATSGTTPFTVAFTANGASLPVGTHTASLSIACDGAVNSPVLGTATLTVGTQLTVNGSLSFRASVGSTGVPSQTLLVNSSGDALSFSASAISSGWLSVTTSSGSVTPGSVIVSVNPSGLGVGSYSGSIILTAPNALNSPLVVYVSLTMALQIQQPSVIAVSPQSGSGSTQVFSATYNHPDGAFPNFATADLLVGTTTSGNQVCHVVYNRVSNSMSLYSDSGTLTGPVVVGTATAPLQNSYCSVNTQASSFSSNGTILTVNYSLNFKTPLAGAMNVYLRAQDIAGQDTGWQQRGSWTVAAPAPLTSKISVFRAGLWVQDFNGSGVWDGLSVDRAIYLGQAGDIPITGDWNGSGRLKAGVFRNGMWILDYNGNGIWDGPSIDRLAYLGQAGDVPVIGDWNGDGKAKIGIFRAGMWILDYNGNGAWDGPGADRFFYLGQTGDSPILGDWNGDGRMKTGIFRAGMWILDYNGNGAWDGPGADRFFYLGQAGDTPVIGDWNGDRRSKAGIFRAGMWILDYNGNGAWDGSPTDRYFNLGQTGDTPLVGDWNGSGTSKAGIFRNGTWLLDYNGNANWEPSLDRQLILGQTADTPTPGVW